MNAATTTAAPPLLRLLARAVEPEATSVMPELPAALQAARDLLTMDGSDSDRADAIERHIDAYARAAHPDAFAAIERADNLGDAYNAFARPALYLGACIAYVILTNDAGRNTCSGGAR